GIPADKHALLFQKFSQADASTTRRFGGTGLGLAISKQLAELMDGEIGLNSEEGVGSEFWFTARLDKQTGRPSVAPPPADIRGTRVLVVDDNTTNREVLTAQLASWDVRVGEARDGISALEALHWAKDEGDAFAAAVLDMQMPGMDGADLARAIKADGRIASTPLVLMTSLGHRGDSREMHEIGFAAYLVKPTRQSDLFDALSVVLAGAPTSAGGRVGAGVPADLEAVALGLGGADVRILLAEDNVTNQQVAIGILAKFGLRADVAVNGLEALRALEKVPYDVVLMDVQMPEMDGLEATRQIRDPGSSVLDHQVPIIAMTAHAMRGDRDRCLQAGMDDYLTKPVHPRALAGALERWLARPGRPRHPGLPASARLDDALTDAGEAATPVFDRAGMLGRLMGDEDLAGVVALGFIEDIPKQIELLRNGLAAGDIELAARQAHAIKGAAANVGGEVLRAVATEMEEAGRAGDPEAVAALLPALESGFAALAVAMREIAGGPADSEEGSAP
ncbi:MAG: response regulator, partial [Chloroflexota bacterium]